MIKQKHLVEIDRVKADLHEAMQVKSQALIDKQFRIFDDEKAELYAQIRELEAATGNYKNIKKEYEMRSVFTKWLFISKIRSIRSLSEL